MSNLSPDFTLPINFCANPQDAWTIPARFYTDSQAFEHEKERIFANSWICVAHGSEVARPNDYITREIISPTPTTAKTWRISIAKRQRWCRFAWKSMPALCLSI